jgi:hypothetical protein
MGHLGRAVKVDVHLVAQRRHVHVDEQVRGGRAGDAPDNVGGLAAVPRLDLGEEGDGVGRGGDVGGDVVEALRGGVLCGGLDEGQRGLQLLGAAGDEDDVCAFGGELLGGGEAEAF